MPNRFSGPVLRASRWSFVVLLLSACSEPAGLQSIGDEAFAARLAAVADGAAQAGVPQVVEISPPRVDLGLGEGVRFSAKVFDGLGNAIADPDLTWSSSDGSVLGIDPKAGAARGFSLGSAVVTASVGAASGTSAVSIVGNPPSRISAFHGSGQTGSPGSELPQVMVARVFDASGAPLPGVAVTWTVTSGGGSVDQPSVLTNQNGAAATRWTLGPSAGTQGLRAWAGTAGAAFTATAVQDTATGSVTAHHGSGQTGPVGSKLPQAIVAQVFDASGNPVPGVTLTWSIVSGGGSVTNTSVTTNQNGAAATRWTLGPVVGTQRLRASAVGSSADFIATGTHNPVSRIQVTPSTSSLSVGGTQQFVAVAYDSSGDTVPGATIAWSSSDPSVATVGADGKATAMAPGTTTISASSAGQIAAAVLSVTGTSVPPVLPVRLPDLPRVYVDTRYRAPGGNRIRVRHGDDLQSAINQAQRGDIIELDPGARFTGSYALPAKPGSGWIVIRTNTALPPEGTRVTPATATNFAVIETTNTRPAIDVMVQASGYRIMGVEIRQHPNGGSGSAIARVGRSNMTQSSLSQVPRDIVFDRVYVHGNPGQQVRRCVLLNGAFAAVIDSHLSECHHSGGDAQAIIAWNTPGPLKIVNNYLEGSGENVMLGGADPKIPNVVPEDVEIRHNHFRKPPSWKGSSYVIKNLLEFKLGRRILVEGNVFENNWIAHQSGYAILIKSANQGGSAPWSVTEHVTFRYNVIRNSSEGINLYEGTANSLVCNTILIAHNVMDRLGPASSFGGGGKILQVVGGVDDLTIEHNTFIGARLTGLTGPAGRIDRLVLRNNVLSGGTYGLAGTGVKEGIAALNMYAAGGWAMDGNVVIGRRARYYPADNHFPVDAASVGFQNYTAGAYGLSASSPYKGVLSGVDPGADIARVNAETRNVN